MKTIPLTQGMEALVDDCDYEYLMQWKWTFQNGYAMRKVGPRGNQQTIYMHREIGKHAGWDLSNKIDHDDWDGLNNRRKNLRPATHQQNLCNRGPTKRNTSGYKGVSRYRSRWRARIMVFGKEHRLGIFDTPEAAARAYDTAAKQYHGAFGFLNFRERAA